MNPRMQIETDAMELLRGMGYKPGLFFDPTPGFVKWLAKETGKGMVIEIGCGQGKLLKLLFKKKVLCLGIEPMHEYVPGDLLDGPRIMQGTAQEFLPSMIPAMAKQRPVIVVVCRPCHSGFVEDTLRLIRGTNCRFLYVSKPLNLKRDLPNYDVGELDLGVIGDDGEKAYWVDRK